MQSTLRQACNTVLNLGEQEEQWQEFPELEEVEPTEVDKLPSEICAEKVEWPTQSRPGDDGTEESTSNKRDTPLPVPSLPQALFL